MNEENVDSIAPSHIVGVGASAGGLEALERFFKAIPSQTGMAFVVVQHLSPDFKSVMDELLSRVTDIEIVRVEEGMQVQADRIYLMPSKSEMRIDGEHLRLTPKNLSHGLSLPIDTFFSSLAQEWGPRAIGVVLSGTGSDGSRGIVDLHQAGGMVLVQSRESAKFDGMPKNAEQTGVADLVRSPDELAVGLDRFAKFPKTALTDLVDTPPVVCESSMGRLHRILQESTGVDFSDYKPATIQRRIERRMLLNEASTFDTYVDSVEADPTELHTLQMDLLIGVTAFFRDEDAFRRLQQRVLPELLKSLSPGDQFRAWVAACSSGEEAYSLAILIHELLEELQLQVDVKIFATDVQRSALEFASSGIYSDASLSEVSPERRARFFVRTDRGYQLIPEIRQMIVFAPHNLANDAPFARLDLVSCRNVLIYLKPELQHRVLSLFHFALKKYGVLFLGPSETLSDLQNEFEMLDGHWKVYRKKRDSQLSRHLRLPIPGRPSQRPSLAKMSSVALTQSPLGDPALSNAYDQLLDRYMPAGVLLNENRELVHVFGDASRFVQLKPGRPSRDGLEWFAPELRAATVGAINRVTRDLKPVHFSGLKLSSDDETVIRLGVEPIVSADNELTYLMVTFEEIAVPTVAASTELNVGDVSNERIGILEVELRSMRENLQAMTEELETRNEELQSMNEEWVASNEELQSTNEELHSVNEELYTVNAEYQKKIVELTEVTDDMDYLLSHLDAGLIFLDVDLGVRKFTPSTARIFNLRQHDIGRSFVELNHSLNRPTLIDDITVVMETKKPFDKEVRDREGRWYMMRIQPYHSRGRVDGVVLELYDVTDIKRTRRQLRREVNRLRAALDEVSTPISISDLKGDYQFINRSFAEEFNVDRTDLSAKRADDSFPTEVLQVLRNAEARSIEHGHAVPIEPPLRLGSEDRMYSGAKVPVCNEEGKIEAVITRLNAM